MRKKHSIYLSVLLSLAMIFVSCDEQLDNAVDNSANNPPDATSVLYDQYVPINWENTSVIASNPETGEYTLSATEETKNLKRGNVIVVDDGTSGHIIIVKNVSVTGDKVNIQGSDGSLCDIFHDYSFTLTTEKERPSTRTTNTNVFRPVRIIYEDRSGRTRSLDVTSEGIRLTDNLWKWKEDLSGETLFEGDHYKISLEEAEWNAGLDLTLDLSFGKAEIVSDQIFQQYRSQALGVRAYVTGKADMTCKIKAEVFGKAEYGSDEGEKWKSNIFKPVGLVFQAMGVPVYVTLSADLYRCAKLETKGSITCTVGAKQTAEGNLGVDWNQYSGLNPINSFEISNEVYPPKVEGEGKVTAKAWLYPRVNVLLYGIVGPTFDIMPYVGSELAGGFKQEYINDAAINHIYHNFFAWSLRNFVGLDAKAGLSLKFMNMDLYHKDTETKNVKEVDIYNSPVEIKLLDATSEKVVKNQKNIVRFMVYDVNKLLNDTLATPLPQVVKIESSDIGAAIKGDFDGIQCVYSIAKNGIVSVEWTPQSATEQLTASLYGPDGNVLSMATFGKEIPKCPDEHHPHLIDLGLPSGTKWQCCNLGATNPREEGNKYAYGETSPKDEYTRDNYPYVTEVAELYDGGCKYKYIYKVWDADIAGTAFDAAYMNLGGSYRMPTTAQFEELFKECESSVARETIKDGNGTCSQTAGLLITGKNGNQLMLYGIFSDWWTSTGDRISLDAEHSENNNPKYTKGTRASGEPQGSFVPCEWGYPIRPVSK